MKITTAKDLNKCIDNSIVKVAGLITLRQRPITANGVTFISLEDETGTINIICWKNIYNKFYKEIISSQLLVVVGRVQTKHGVVNVIAHTIYDFSTMLNFLPNIE